MKKRKLQENLIAYSFLLPSLIGLVFFSMLPLIFSLLVSLTDWNFIQGIGNWNWIGFDNFIKLWSDDWFIAALKNTFVFTIITVPAGLILALVLAALIDTFCHVKMAGVIRISMYMPHICNIVAASAVWMVLYSSYGPFTQMVKALGWSNPPKWLSDYHWALPAVMLMCVWSSLGYRIFMYSASMAGLPKELYEAAEIDGANGIQRFLSLTIPLLQPTTFFLTITGIITSFKVFGQINIMTGGGPGSATYTLVYYIYRRAFTYYEMGYASAVAMILFLILLVITIIQWTHNETH